MSITNPLAQASTETTIEVRNPATGELIGTVPRAGVDVYKRQPSIRSDVALHSL